MWQTKYASAVPKKVGVNFPPCSEGDFLIGRPQSVLNPRPPRFLSLHRCTILRQFDEISTFCLESISQSQLQIKRACGFPNVSIWWAQSAPHPHIAASCKQRPVTFMMQPNVTLSLDLIFSYVDILFGIFYSFIVLNICIEGEYQNLRLG